MTKEKSENALLKLKEIYLKIDTQLKNLKQLEISLKGVPLKKDGHKYALLPDHNKGMQYINDDIIVGLVDLDTQEKLYFDEPVFGVKTITISDIKHVRNFMVGNKSVAENYLFKKHMESKNGNDKN